jgi:hypothetical protein
MVAGGILFLAAAEKQDQVESAPTDTVADLEALADLEATGRKESRWGGALLVVGAVTVAAGVALVIRQGHESPRLPAATLTLVPSLAPDGAGALLTVRADR